MIIFPGQCFWWMVRVVSRTCNREQKKYDGNIICQKLSLSMMRWSIGKWKHQIKESENVCFWDYFKTALSTHGSTFSISCFAKSSNIEIIINLLGEKDTTWILSILCSWYWPAWIIIPLSSCSCHFPGNPFGQWWAPINDHLHKWLFSRNKWPFSINDHLHKWLFFQT